MPTDGDEHYEEVEGLPDDFLGEDEYPLDEVLIRTETRTAYDIIRRMKAGRFILDPDFQRDLVWDEKKQSGLIESALMRIPLPVFYLAENEEGKTIVVDGLQRLTTFSRYLNNEFSLKGLSNSPKLLKKRFKDLSPKLQNRLEDTQLTLYLIDSKVPERAKLDIFERVNGGVPLTRQQMRNAIYMGEATKWLKKQAKDTPFLKATAGSLNPKTMRDRELINRFCAFYLLGVKEYRGDMDDFLARTLQVMNKKSEPELRELGQTFQASMENNFLVFNRQAFRKHTSESQGRNMINVSLFDVYSVLMTRSRYTKAFVQTNSVRLKEIFFQLMGDKDFEGATSRATGDRNNVTARFEKIERAHQEL